MSIFTEDSLFFYYGFPSVIAPDFSTPAFPLLHFQRPLSMMCQHSADMSASMNLCKDYVGSAVWLYSLIKIIAAVLRPSCMRDNIVSHWLVVGDVSFWLTLPPGVQIPSDAMMVWKWGNGNQLDPLPLPFAGPGTFSTSYQYNAPGHYIVQLTVYNLASSVTFAVSVSHPPRISYNVYSFPPAA